MAEFGRTVALRLNRGGQPEDQLRGPLENLLSFIGRRLGIDPLVYGEVALKTLRARPDYAVDVADARVGYLEIKAPGKGVPGVRRWRPSREEREQWRKLSALPNLIYTDGTFWGKYRFGDPVCKPVELAGEVTDPRRPLTPMDASFEALVHDFLLWEPEQPRSLSQLVRLTAGLCRLLRDDVSALLSATSSRTPAGDELGLLALDWHELLFPGLDGDAFSDAYAQTITFAMLLAQVNGIQLGSTPLHEIGRQLGKKHTLIGKAFSVLTDTAATEELGTIETLRRVIGAVDWSRLDDGRSNVYAELYEDFLTAYDPALRKQSGSYYTPEPVARSMVGFVDKVLQTRLRRPWGFADEDVVTMDPAMGTGTFLVEVVQKVAETIEAKQGRGAWTDRLRELFRDRLIGFERQVAPYAVAELRLHEALRVQYKTDVPAQELRFLTDALEDPHRQPLRLGAPYKVIQDARRRANEIKRETPVLVVIGNPPHVQNVKGQVPWLEQDSERDALVRSVRERPSIKDFSAAGSGRYESDLHGLQWYFWRWAVWKVFEAHPQEATGVVALITPSSLMTSRAFAGMREYLRRTCDEGWVIDLSPEGNRSRQQTRVFGPKVMRRLCVAIFIRSGPANSATPARVNYLALGGSREEKSASLKMLHPDDSGWARCQVGWQDPLAPEHGSGWERFPALGDLMPWRSRGITTGRSWVYAPSPDVLRRRWRELALSALEKMADLFHEGRDRKIGSKVSPLPGFAPSPPLVEDREVCPEPVPVAYRSFDRQWIIPDSRLMEMPRPPLWAVRSKHQIYVSEQDVHEIESGPALVFSGLIMDLHHFNSRDGGCRPLFRDVDARAANLLPGLANSLSRRLGKKVESLDLVAYLAAVVAHRGFTKRFRRELQMPGVRVPLSASPSLWEEAVSLGQEIIWLHTFGERFWRGLGRRSQGARPLIEASGIRLLSPIVRLPPGLPLSMNHDEATRILHIGDGEVAPVQPAVMEYDVGGLRVVRHWFNYRCAEPPHKRRSSELDDIHIDDWNSQLTDELLAMLAVVTGCIEREPRQADLLSRVCEGDLISTDDLTSAGVLPVPVRATRAPRVVDSDADPLFI